MSSWASSSCAWRSCRVTGDTKPEAATMIVCNRCGKENQDHYKFCLGCGAELATGPAGDDAGNVGTMKTMMADSGQRISPTPPGGVPHTRLPGVGAAPAGLPG